MGTGFDPFKDIGTAVGGVSAAIGSAAQAAAESVSRAATEIGEGLFGGHAEQDDLEAAEGREPELRYTGRVGDAAVVVPQSITVSVIGLDARGRPIEGRRQRLKMSKKGVQLLASDAVFAKPVEAIAVGSCTLFQEGKTPMGNPLLNGLGGAVGPGIGAGVALGPVLAPVGAIAGAIIGGASALKTRNIWFAEIRAVDGKEYVFKLDDKSDGDKLLEFLDTYMLA